MKNSVFCLSLATALFTVSFARADEPDTELGKQMETVGDSYKALAKETDPAKGAALAREAEAGLIKCLAEVPKKIGKLPEAEKPKALANYRTLMGKLYVSFSEIEEAFLANDLDKVKTLVAAAKDQKKEGHGKYIEKKEK